MKDTKENRSEIIKRADRYGDLRPRHLDTECASAMLKENILEVINGHSDCPWLRLVHVEQENKIRALKSLLDRAYIAITCRTGLEDDIAGLVNDMREALR